jgi:hypothetical protein
VQGSADQKEYAVDWPSRQRCRDCLAESEPAKLTDPGIEQRDRVLKARRSQHKGVLTRGIRPELYLLNPADFLKPFGPRQFDGRRCGVWPRLEGDRRASAVVG